MRKEYTLEGLVFNDDGTQQTLTVRGEQFPETTTAETVEIHASFLNMSHYVWWVDNQLAGYDVIIDGEGVPEDILEVGHE